METGWRFGSGATEVVHGGHVRFQTCRTQIKKKSLFPSLKKKKRCFVYHRIYPECGGDLPFVNLQ